MATLPSTARPALAIVLILGAIFCFGLMDVAVKAAGVQTSVLIILWARYGGQLLIVLVLKARQLPRLIHTRYLGLQIARSVLLLLATAFFFLALGQIGLAQATAIMALNPVLITLGGALLLGEALGLRRIAAIIVALVGALIVIQPGSEVFQPAALLPLAGAACFAGHALITRSLGPDEDVWTSMLYTGIVGAVIMTALAPFDRSAVAPDATLLLIAVGLFGTVGQVLLVRAFSLAEAGTLAPFIYTGLIWAVIWGVVLFDERPDGATLFGALVIAGAGIYVWHRETRTR
ncbi:DMT family transporter [uncultured Tateyamaria sp.]|uniref:DMT family transporter n=1 Tax=uncultured Tateyamaria sp. TaxID=455651 RepID=UPI0026193C00|nr:DMT family transporter [uncultured Tateyamaria sp.]